MAMDKKKGIPWFSHQNSLGLWMLTSPIKCGIRGLHPSQLTEVPRLKRWSRYTGGARLVSPIQISEIFMTPPKKQLPELKT